MGYRCPVCEAPQPDAKHLANHLAFTGLMAGENHELWLDDHVPDWAEHDPESLGEALAEIVPTTELDGIGSDDHQHDRPSVDPVSRNVPSNEELDPVTRAALAEAREMTQEMEEQSRETSETSDSEDADREEGEDR